MTQPQSFDPHETIPLPPRTGVPVWLFLTTVLLLVAAGAGGLYFVASRQPAVVDTFTSHVATPAPDVVAQPATQQAPKPSPYAVEMACAHVNSPTPPDETVAEFDRLITMALEQYSRTTEMEVRDATYKVYSLRAYNRPDISVVSALRMIVAWRPPDVQYSAAYAGQARTDTTREAGSETPPQKESVEAAGAEVSAERLTYENIPIGLAVDSITEEIVGAYNKAVEAQWAARYAQEMASQAAMANNRARMQAQRRAQAEAAAKAQAERNQAIQNMEQWKAQNSVAGQYWRR